MADEFRTRPLLPVRPPVVIRRVLGAAREEGGRGLTRFGPDCVSLRGFAAQRLAIGGRRRGVSEYLTYSPGLQEAESSFF